MDNQGLQLQVFNYVDNQEDHFEEIGTIEIDGEVWFIASDVCKALGIVNTTRAVSTLDDDEKLPFTIDRSGQKRRVNIVSESGLYNLVFRSRKPSANKFRKWITKEVIPTIRKTGSFGQAKVTPKFVRRFNKNWDRVERGHFSVISELFIRLYGRLEQLGFIIPDKAPDGVEIRPDNSVGRLFSDYLKKYHPDQKDNYKTYKHSFESGMEVDARQYPLDLLPTFMKYVDDVWIPERAGNYFMKRAPEAIDYLPKLLPEGYSTDKFDKMRAKLKESAKPLSKHNKSLKQALNWNPNKDS